MESPISGSFIPKRMGTGVDTSSYDVHKGGIEPSSIVMMLGVIALVVGIALSVVVFLYDQFAQNELKAKKADVQKVQESLKADNIKVFAKLDSRITASEFVLNKHIAPSIIIRILQDITLRNVQYTSFDFVIDAQDQAKIDMKGRAASVNSVALQATLFSRHQAISDPIFSDLDIDKDGVRFAVSANIHPQSISFKEYVTAALQAGKSGEQSQQGNGMTPEELKQMQEEAAMIEAKAQAQRSQTVQRGVQRAPATGAQTQQKPKPVAVPAKNKAADELFGTSE